MKNKIVIGLMVFIAFGYGVLVGKMHIFPYNEISQLKQVLLSGEGSLKGFSPHYNHKVIQFNLLDKDSVAHIAMIGDSITEGGLWNELFRSENIINRGIGGDTTMGVLNRLDSLNNQVQKVFLMIGTNDLAGGKNTKYIMENYEKIVKKLIQKNIYVYIQSILYVGKFDISKRDNEEIKRINNFLEKLASKHKKIDYIELNTLLSPNGVLSDKYSSDNLHINGVGYKIWVSELKKYLK